MNRFGPEGARALSEPLGKLTALQMLNLEGNIFILFLYLGGDVLRLRERGMRGVGLSFSLACQGMTLGLKGRGLCLSRSASWWHCNNWIFQVRFVFCFDDCEGLCCG